MYKQLLKHKLGYLIQSSNTSIINSPAKPQAYRRFDENKEKEIIVWIRQQQGLDKQQIKDAIKDKFNISNEDAEKLYYEAYPDGLNSQEEEYMDYLEEILPQECPEQLLDNAIIIVMNNGSPSNLDGVEEETAELFTDYLQKLFNSRKLVHG